MNKETVKPAKTKRNFKTPLLIIGTSLVLALAGFYFGTHYTKQWENTNVACQKKSDCTPYYCECCKTEEEVNRLDEETGRVSGCSSPLETRCHRGSCQYSTQGGQL